MSAKATVCDGHAHLGSEEGRRLRERENIPTMVCAGDEKEAAELAGLSGSWLVKAYGLHPWKASLEGLAAMEPWLEQARIIGEIGLDSVWCQVDETVQRQVFERQLALAFAGGKPVVLHVKGREREAAELIRRYPNTYLVHWYSDLKWLELYLEQDCFFTVGPDVAKNPAVQQVARMADISRLMVETDGLGAVRWALGENIPLEGIPAVLSESARWIAAEKKMEPQAVLERLEENFWRFVGDEWEL